MQIGCGALLLFWFIDGLVIDGVDMQRWLLGVDIRLDAVWVHVEGA